MVQFDLCDLIISFRCIRFDGFNGLDDVEYRIIFKDYNDSLKLEALGYVYLAHREALRMGAYMTEDHRVVIRFMLDYRDDDMPFEFDRLTLEELLRPIIEEGDINFGVKIEEEVDFR